MSQVLRAGILVGGLLGTVPGLNAAGAAEEIRGEPLVPPAGSPGSTLFVPMAPDTTGIHTENHYADPRMWGDLYEEFESGSIGTGVAIGDYDGDGRPDLFVVSKTDSCRLFRNRGDFSFEDVTERALVADTGTAAAIWKHGVTFVDINNDGRLDLYVCRFNAPNLLYVSQGNGTFREMAAAVGLDVVDASVMAAFCDYDRDGRLDVHIATNMLDHVAHPQGQRGYLFHQESNGTFTNVTDRTGIRGEAQTHSSTWWDYDNDGWPDLYVANDYGVPDKLYHNNRDGTFADVMDRVVPHTAHYSMGSDIGDVNNDGLIDLLVADMAATSHYKNQHSIAEAREQSVETENSPAAPKYRRSALLLNTDTGHCLEAACLAGISATNWTWAPRFEDLDNDGRVDYFVTNGFNTDPDPDVHQRAMSAGSLAERNKILRDTPLLKERHLAFRNLGDLHFVDVSAPWGLNEEGVSFGAAFGDLDGDGDLDLVYTNYEAGITVLRNAGETGHRMIFDLRGTDSNRFGIGATIQVETAGGIQVRQLWLARGYMSSSEPAAHFGLGDETLIKRVTVTWPSGRVQTFADLPADQRWTITEPSNISAPRPAVVRATPRGQFVDVSEASSLTLRSREEPVAETVLQRLLPFRLNRRGPALAVGRLNGDDIDDIVIGGTTLDPLRVVQGSTAGLFVEPLASPPATGAEVNDGPLLMFDADGDGDQDLLVTKGGNSFPAGAREYQPRLFLNDGRGGFRAAVEGTLPELFLSAGAAAAADYDRDGRLDVFIGGRVLTGEYPLPPLSALLVNRRGTFADVTDTLAPGLRDVGMVTGALWSDVDDDGWPDLLLTLDWGSVKYFHNNAGKGFEDWSERAGFAAAGTGWWTAIAGADFNRDARIDYVVGNTGLNTPYQVSAEYPALLFSGDFKNSSSTQLVEAHYDGGVLYPVRSRKALGAAIPAVMKRFLLNESYARATLEEIVGKAKLSAARKFAVSELRSGIFLNQPDGTFRFEPLPRMAQIAPLQGIVAGDFDGDGNADIYAVQNSYAPIPPTGRFDGGLSQLLLGDGDGHFNPVPPAVSGLVVPGNAKALAVIDLDHDAWPDFVLTRNNDTTMAYRNRGVAGHYFLCVRLQGPAGNPTAVGARITVQLTDGFTQTSEVGAGAGFSSQSTAACFFGFPEGNPPKEIRVRWPSGVTTRHDAAATKPIIILSAP